MTDFSHVAVIVPCLNEEKTIAEVVLDHLQHLPGAQIYVFDNNSTDATARIASGAGAHVIRSPHRGKGNVVRHMFEAVDARVYLMVDGDATYPAKSAAALIHEVTKNRIDMCVGNRLNEPSKEGSFRRFHSFGNTLISGLVSLLFGVRLIDVLSGYRAFSRSFAKSVPLISNGFEIETEMTLQAVSKGFAVKEIPIEYGSRPEGSKSKLSTFSDGARILKSLALIFKNYRPFLFFATLAAFLAVFSLLCGSLPIYEYFRYHYVYRIPLAILATGLGILSVFSFSVGMILDSVAHYQRENFELFRKVLVGCRETAEIKVRNERSSDALVLQ